MGTSLKLGRIAGIDLQVHWTFILLPLIALFSTFGNPAAFALNLVWIASVFACVVLHELGHALMARHFGIGTQDITLLPIGGVARLHRIPEKPNQELAIALAGPAVNVVIAGVLFGVLVLTGGLAQMTTVAALGSSFLVQLLAVNLFLVAFNLIPAFPMDGGRVLRAVLAYKWSYPAATRIAANVGKWIAFAMGIYGLVSGNFMLAILATFVYFAGMSEARAVEARARARAYNTYTPFPTQHSKDVVVIIDAPGYERRVV